MRRAHLHRSIGPIVAGVLAAAAGCGPADEDGAAAGSTSQALYQRADETHPPIKVAAAVNDLSELRVGGDQDTRMFLFRVTASGLEQKVWSGTSATGSWDPGWTPRNQSTVRGQGPEGTSIAALGGEYFSSTYGIYLPRFNAFYDFTNASGQLRVGAPSWNWLPSGYSWSELQPPGSGGFQPWSGFAWRNGQALRINMFGTVATKGSDGIVYYRSLRELWYNGSSWAFTEHGRPPGGSITHVRMGPSSAVWTNPTGVGEGYVFVTGSDEQLHYRYYSTTTCPGWCWDPVQLGRPARARWMRTPVALTYSLGGRRRVTVFVSAETGDGQHLYSRHHNGSSWEEWQDWGIAPGIDPLDATPANTRPGFDMTSGVVWWDRGVLRINLFGTTDRGTRRIDGRSVPTGGKLVNFFWDGSRWSWGQTVPSPGTYDGVNPRQLQTMSAAVVNTRTWTRLSVFAVDHWGVTLERYWDGSSWSWRTH
jgi:hypothetical protein